VPTLVPKPRSPTVTQENLPCRKSDALSALGRSQVTLDREVYSLKIRMSVDIDACPDSALKITKSPGAILDAKGAFAQRRSRPRTVAIHPQQPGALLFSVRADCPWPLSRRSCGPCVSRNRYLPSDWEMKGLPNFGPQLGLVAGLDELGGDAEPVAVTSHPSKSKPLV